MRKKTLASLTDWPAEKVEALRQVLKGQRLIAPEDAFAVERSLPHGHVEALLAMTRRLGLERLIAPKRCPERNRVLAMVLERVLHPGSKLATTRLWHSTTLAEELGVGDTLKGLEVRVRPIRHREERRVRAHLFVCLLAGYVEWHLRRALAPLLFDDETLHEARRTRDPVATAKPTPRAREKNAGRRTDDGLALHSLDTLIAELATRCRNTCRVLCDPAAPPFALLTEPSRTQRRAAQLIEMFPVPGPAEI